jgi:ATPase subunit of ABC transporter with duplicated ATPase domains
VGCKEGENAVAEEVVNSVVDQSAEVVAPEVATVPTENDGDVATWKKRLAGKDQALTAAKKELDDIKSKAEELSRWKAEQEQAQMTEFEKAQAKIRDLESKAAAAEAAAKEERLAREFPLAYQFQKDTSGLDEASRAAALEKFIRDATASKEQVETAPTIVDPNNARRATAAPTTKPDSKSISEKLKGLGNPFAD